MNEILTNSDQLKLRQDVIKDIFHLDFDSIRATDIISVLKQYVSLDEKLETKLKEDLNSLLLSEQKSNTITENSSKGDLLQMIKNENIVLAEDRLSWESILNQSSQALVNQKLFPQTIMSFCCKNTLINLPILCYGSVFYYPILIQRLLIRSWVCLLPF